jgi:hypothetical protein
MLGLGVGVALGTVVGEALAAGWAVALGVGRPVGSAMVAGADGDAEAVATLHPATSRATARIACNCQNR